MKALIRTERHREMSLALSRLRRAAQSSAPAALATLEEVMHDIDARRGDRVKAAKEILLWAYGGYSLTPEEGGIDEHREEFERMTPAERVELLERLLERAKEEAK